MKRLIKTTAGLLIALTLSSSFSGCKKPEAPDIIDENAPFTAEGSIKILTIGNSFGLDSTKYLYELLDSTGRYTDIVIGNLYIGGCTIDRHYEYLRSNLKAYYYFLNDSGEWKISQGMDIKTAVTSDDWNVIIFQNYLEYQKETFTHLQDLMNDVRAIAPDAIFLYNSTWLPNNSKALFPKVSEMLKTDIVTNEDIKGLIPIGTMIENLRTAKIVPSLFRDDAHLDLGCGSYSASLISLRAITGYNIDKIKWTPADQPEVKAYLETIKKAVNAAVSDPYTPVDMSDTVLDGSNYTKDADILKAVGLNIEDYNLVALTWTSNKKYTAKSDSLQTSTYHYALQTFTKETLPVGSVIISDDVSTVTPVKWKDKTGSEDGIHPWNASHLIVIDESFWDGYDSCGLNIAHYSWELGAQYINTNSVRIYTPKNN